jgi:uncharacterized protein (TIGR04255 family)
VAPESLEQDLLASFQQRAGKDYPTKEVRTAWTDQVEFKSGAQPVTHAVGKPDGYLFRSADGKRVVQARNDGFTFSRLKPYQDWASLSNEARWLWEQYVELVKPRKVTRVAVRYLNRVELPTPFEHFKEYVLTVPEIAPELPQGLASFFFRVVIPDDASPSVAIVTETIENESTGEGKLPLIFDIDVVRTGTFSTASEKLWPIFEELRDFKNRVFHRSFTEKAKEMFR